ncbi:hypothetical protein Tco_0328769 [Tanacetum coccineum]
MKNEEVWIRRDIPKERLEPRLSDGTLLLTQHEARLYLEHMGGGKDSGKHGITALNYLRLVMKIHFEYSGDHFKNALGTDITEQLRSSRN